MLSELSLIEGVPERFTSAMSKQTRPAELAMKILLPAEKMFQNSVSLERIFAPLIATGVQSAPLSEYRWMLSSVIPTSSPTSIGSSSSFGTLPETYVLARIVLPAYVLE